MKSGNIAVDQLKSIIARVENLEESKAGITQDIADVATKTVVGLPIAVVADVVTLGGELTDKRGRTHTGDMLLRELRIPLRILHRINRLTVGITI